MAIFKNIYGNRRNWDKYSQLQKEEIRREIVDNNECDVQTFTSHQNLTNFCIDFNSTVIESKPIPKLEESFLQNRSGLSTDLEEGYETCLRIGKLITNYRKYRIEKWEHFLKVLLNKEIITEEKPDFVSNAGNIWDMIDGNLRDIFAIKYQGVIYLSRSKTLEFDPELGGNITKGGFYGLTFLYSITDRDESELNQFEKYFNINRFDLKEHRLLVCSEVEALDSRGELIEAKCRTKLNYGNPVHRRMHQQKLLSDWSQCLVNNVKTMVVGYRDENILKTTEVVSVDSIPRMGAQYWSPSKRFRFAEQFLDFIKICVEPENQLFGFDYNEENRSLICFKYTSPEDNPTFFLPQWYRNSIVE